MSRPSVIINFTLIFVERFFLSSGLKSLNKFLQRT